MMIPLSSSSLSFSLFPLSLSLFLVSCFRYLVILPCTVYQKTIKPSSSFRRYYLLLHYIPLLVWQIQDSSI